MIPLEHTVRFLASSYLKAVLPALTPPVTGGRKWTKDRNSTELARAGADLPVSG